MIGTVCAGLEAYSFFTGDSTRNDGESVDTRGARARAPSCLTHVVREPERQEHAARGPALLHAPWAPRGSIRLRTCIVIRVTHTRMSCC